MIRNNLNNLIVVVLLASPVLAHDTWVETNTNVVRTGDAVYVDLKLGNHGNDHRDFKLASKVDLEGSTMDVLSPDGNRTISKPSLRIRAMLRRKATGRPSLFLAGRGCT